MRIFHVLSLTWKKFRYIFLKSFLSKPRWYQPGTKKKLPESSSGWWGGRGYALQGNTNSCFTLDSDPDTGWLDNHVWWWHAACLAIV